MKSGKRPTTNQTAWRNRMVLWVLVLLLGGGGAAWYLAWVPGASLLQPKAPQTTQTYTTAVKRGDLRISAAGSAKLVAYQSVDLSFSVTGTLAELKVELGDRVKAGQVLASLGSSQSLEAALAAARLQVITAEKSLADLQENADLALAQAYSDLIAAQETYDTAQKTSARMTYARCGQDAATRLVATLERAAQQLANVHAEKEGSDAYIAAKQAYDTALANYNACAAYTTTEKNSVASELEIARTALQTAQDQYDTLKAAAGVDPSAQAMAEANLKVAQAQLAKAEDQLAGITLVAPIAGKVTYLAASEGALVSTSKLITISDVSHSMLEISVDEADIDKLQVGAVVTTTFDALPDLTFTGTVVQVNPEMTNSGQYRIAKGVVELDAAAVKTVSTLPLGLSASVTIHHQEAQNALLMPVVALQDLGNHTYGALVQGSDGQLRMQTVTVGIQDHDYVEITAGLNEGDLVSTGTVNFIAAGSSSSSSALKNAQDAGGPPAGGGMPPAP